MWASKFAHPKHSQIQSRVALDPEGADRSFDDLHGCWSGACCLRAGLTGEVEVRLSIHQPVIRSRSLLGYGRWPALMIARAMMMWEQAAKPISWIRTDLLVQYSTCV